MPRKSGSSSSKTPATRRSRGFSQLLSSSSTAKRRPASDSIGGSVGRSLWRRSTPRFRPRSGWPPMKTSGPGRTASSTGEARAVRTEEQSALATLRAEVGEAVEEPEEPPRWLRGRLRLLDGCFELEVNSEERLAMLLAVLGELGLEPKMTRGSAMDPAQDMLPIPLRRPMPFGASQETIDAWLEHCPTSLSRGSVSSRRGRGQARGEATAPRSRAARIRARRLPTRTQGPARSRTRSEL